MEDLLFASDVVDREKALTLAALAAKVWLGRKGLEQASGQEIVSHLMRAAAWASRARAHHGLRPISLAELVAAFERPVQEWLPGAGTLALGDEGDPSPFCVELVDDAGSSALSEIEQRVILKAMDNLGDRPDAAQAYTAFRRFLVEHASATIADAARALRDVGVDLSEVYEPIAVGAKVSSPSGDVFFPCPRCRWPMTVRDTGLSCTHSSACLASGARFRLQDGALLPLGKLPSPKARPCAGSASLRVGVWRYTVLPGLEELSLERRLAEIKDVAVVLWPFIDCYDLDVRRGDRHWRIDVKEHSSVMRLARHLVERPAREPTWIVVPDTHRDQVPTLQRIVPREAGYSFACSSDVVRDVRGVA